MTRTKTFDLRTGALAPALRLQLAAQGLAMDPDERERAQGDLDAVTRLHARGLLTDGQARGIRERITADVARRATAAAAPGRGGAARGCAG